MAILTAGSLVPFDNLDYSFGFLEFITFTQRQSDLVRGDFRFLGVPEAGADLFGQGFRYDSNGALTGGTVTGLRFTFFGETGFSLRELSVSVPRLTEIVFAGDDPGWAAILNGNDLVVGSPFDDRLRGYAGDDRLMGGPGNDVLEGGGGVDRAVVTADGGPAELALFVWNGVAATVPVPGGAALAQGVDKLLGVEAVEYQRSDGSVIATAAIGADTFSPLQYLASYGDLADAFGTDQAAAFDHYVYAGIGEGRRPGFDATAYLAANTDVLAALGPDATAATLHYLAHGRFEGRAVSFDGLQYIASHADLIRVFGPDAAAGTAHFVAAGFREGRSPDSFDAARYLANNPDLRAVFGSDEAAATRHFITFGFAEGRSDDPPAAPADFLL